MFFSKTIWSTFLVLVTFAICAQESQMVLIKRGAYVPLYGTADKKPVTVEAFKMDVYPVTNAQFLSFVKKHPEYSRSKMKGIFAEKSYLAQWQNDFDYGKTNLSNAPVTNVSWFIAKKYCECQEKRMPTMDEWEYVAMADEKRIDARSKEEFNKYILSWYEKPKTYSNPVGKTFKNYWGVYDMHGLVWEWVSDFNSNLVSSDNREGGNGDKAKFCGAGTLAASEKDDYASFMRLAFRSSLKAAYTTASLGFRCAKNP